MSGLWDPETCWWMSALARAGGLEWRATYWLTCGYESWWPGVGGKA